MSLSSASVPRYQALDGAIIGRNQPWFFNRPLYSANSAAFILAGDKPVLRFASEASVHGTFCAGIIRAGRARWLHDCSDITTEFRGGHIRWQLRDRRLAGLAASLEVVSLGDEPGCAMKLSVTGTKPGDELFWVYGGAVTREGQNLNWEMDPHRDPKLTTQPFDPAYCAGNVASFDETGFTLAETGPKTPISVVQCNRRGLWRLADAAKFANPLALLSSESADRPLVCGRLPLAGKSPVLWSITRDQPARQSPAKTFVAGLTRARALARQIEVKTPDAHLNAMVAMLPAALDGAWYPPVFRHGAMLWNIRFPGWRTVFGGTVAGWIDRVVAQAEFYCASQVKSNRLRSLVMEEKYLLTIPAADSRFYGRGRIKQDQAFYNMQTQFFDQLVHAWRWTGDAKLEKILRPALELHLEWARDCFDPDGDGLYESVINVWPTDSIWYGGGGGAEETAYAYRGHLAARDLARRAGDAAAVRRHERRLALIQTAFQQKLWIKAKGHAGLYLEQGENGRLHEDAWLYSVFMPIDAGLVDEAQAVQSLHYTERSLQNDAMPFGGRRVWTSNFVPGMWSVRELWPGDNYHLALAYFQTGLAAGGWELLRGNLLHTAFNQRVPGDFGAPIGGTDFGDCAHMFARTLVEGLFGYAPDYPNHVVRIAPQFPEKWPEASLRTPDVHLQYTRRGPALVLVVELKRAAPLEISLPVNARDVAKVTLNGKKATWSATPGYGCTRVQVKLGSTRRARLHVTLKAPAKSTPAITVEGQAGELVRLRVPGAEILAFEDAQGALTEANLSQGVITGRLVGSGATARVCTVQARVRFGALEQLRLFQLQISDATAVATERARAVDRVPKSAAWQCVPMAQVLNGDIRTIYQQDYLSPRPATMSVRIGRDGYSPWTFPHWKSVPPIIALEGVERLREPAGERRLLTPQGVPFGWTDEARNVAFTSRWDNWPTTVTVPVHASGEAVWFLICGSTNPMQGHIANAVLRLRYADGGEDTLELVPPFNYWNLSPIRSGATSPGQEGREDYLAPVDRFCLPEKLPERVQLGQNCRAMLLNRKLRPGVTLESVTLETLSPEVVVGLMGVTVMKKP